MLSCTQSEDTVNVDWTIVHPGPDRSRAGTALKMTIPKKYVRHVYADKTGEAERLRGVKNSGIEIVSLVVALPQPGSSSEAKEVQVDLSADVVRVKGIAGIKNQLTFEARRGMVYRLPELYGLDRYRRIGCSERSNFDASRADQALEAPPAGCWELGEESLLGMDGDVGCWITCGRGGGQCVMRTSFRGAWSVLVIFSSTDLARWKTLRQQVEEVLTAFVAK